MQCIKLRQLKMGPAPGSQLHFFFASSSKFRFPISNFHQLGMASLRFLRVPAFRWIVGVEIHCACAS